MASEVFVIEGGKKLNGEITPQGAKNEALQVLCVPLLTDQKVIIENVPNIVDVVLLINLLKGLGVKIEKLNANTYSFQADDVNLDFIFSPQYIREAQKIRGSVMLVGPLLSRFKKAQIPKPGGDKIGRRRLDTHFLSFEKLGAHFNFDDEKDMYFIEGNNLKGTYIHMDEISVTGSANIIMAAVLTPGSTTLYNVACEPYVQQLCRMLTSMGANIQGVGSNLLTIVGVEKLSGTSHRILPDMIEIGSFIGLAAMTQSDLLIKDCRIDQLGIIPDTFRKLGIQIDFKGDDIHIPAQEEYEISSFIDGSILTVYDAPWPGFTPDLMSILLVTATQARGSVLIHQKMFESRLFFVDKLIDMGAQIILCDPHRATVIGLNRKYPLKAITMTSPDIRAGVSLLIAAMSAKGTSVIRQINQIDRGYENIDGRLNSLGASIDRALE